MESVISKTKQAIWEERIKLCYLSGIGVCKWCELNSISKSSFYKWAKRLREEDPEQLPVKQSPTSNGWVRITKEDLPDSQALVVRDEPPLAITTDVTSNAITTSSASPIRALVNGIELAIPSGVAQSDLIAVFKAAKAS